MRNAPSGSESTDELFPKVYSELRRLAGAKISREQADFTLSGTDLLHEAYLRLKKDGSLQWSNKKQFFSAAAESMRRILIERIRSKKRIKRGRDYQRVDFDEEKLIDSDNLEELFAIDEALDVMAKVDPEGADLVKLRFFVGSSLEEIAEAQGVSVRTISRHWRYAQTWLQEYLSRHG